MAELKLNVKFRPGNTTDLDQIKDLTWLAYSQFKNILSEENILAWKNTMTDKIIYENLFKTASCFICEHENRIIGSAFLVPHGNPFKWFDDECCYIRLVSVHPDFEGKGIGKKLTQMCIDLAKSSGEKIIALHTSEFQNAARHIYESMGFVKLKDLELIYGKQYYLYTLELS